MYTYVHVSRNVVYRIFYRMNHTQNYKIPRLMIASIIDNIRVFEVLEFATLFFELNLVSLPKNSLVVPLFLESELLPFLYFLTNKTLRVIQICSRAFNTKLRKCNFMKTRNRQHDHYLYSEFLLITSSLLISSFIKTDMELEKIQFCLALS